MKKNMSSTDSIIRILIALIVAVLYFTHVISGTLAIVLGVIAVIFILTSFISFCPIYYIFGISSRKKQQ
jgi:hypothetical protein